MAPEGESNVVATLEAMAELVRRGDIVEARELGNTCSIPLGVGQQHLKLLEKVADGPASTVWKAEWDGIQALAAFVYRGYVSREMSALTSDKVAVKKPRIASSSDLDRFKQELALLAELAGHRNIARLMGACAVPPNYQMFLEWEEQNLETQIHHFGWRPDWPTVLDMAAQLGEAVSAVHSREILHRDLKPGNVLRSADGCVRLTDFGIAEKVEVLQMMYEVVSRGGRATVAGPTGGYHKRLMLGTMEYMAPEVLCKQPHSTASDVYALAVTVNELATGTFPFSNCTTENPKAHTILEMHYGRQELAAAVSSEGLRPILPDEAPAGYAELMDRCWAKDPSQRPSADEFLDEVLRIKSHLGDTAVGVAADTYCSNGAASQPSINGAAPVTTVHRHDAGPPARTEGAATSGPQAMDVTTTDRNAAIDLHDLPACADAATWAQGCNAFPCLTAGGYATAGRRGETKMEDRHVIKASFRGMNPCCLLGVFDGHRGWEAAEYARVHLDEAMDQSWREAGNPGALMHRVFEGLDEGFEAERSVARREEVERMGAAAGPEVFPGCTAMVALVCGRQLLLAGAGDCRGVLCRAGGAVQLSRDHTADDPEERGRVQGLGGRVEWRVNGWRVGTEGLQVTRSLGDRDLRGDGVTAAPEVVGHVLDERDQFLVLASDGLWDKLSNEEAVGLVLDTVKHPGMAAQRLATEALTRGSQDNITVLVLFLRPVRTLESIFRNGDEKHRITPTLHGSLPILASGPCPDELREQF